MYSAPYQGVAENLAQYGRFGDSQLVHMNPIEVQMLGSLSPTGELTINPVTGQREAFLPFLAPLLGSFLGKAFLPTLIPALTGKAALAGALGSTLATTAATGDLKEGIMSGLTGYGLGKVFGAMGGAGDASKALTDATTKAIPQAITPEALNVQALSTGFKPELSTSLLKTAPSGIEGFLPMSERLDLIGQNLQMPMGPESAAAAGSGGMDFSAGLQELMKPGTFLPIYAGVSGTEGMRQQAELERIMKEQGLSEEEAKRKYEEDARRAIETAQRLYPQMRPPTGMAAGGQVEGYFDGGMFGSGSNMDAGFYNTQFGQTSPSDIQGRLRGNISVASPYASYDALDVGGRGYLPGISPEFQYFRQAEEVYPQQPLYPTMNRGKGGGFGGGNQFGGMPGGKGGGFGNQFGGGFGNQFGGGFGGRGGFGNQFGGGYSSMPSKGGYANPRNSMGFGGYNTDFGGGFGGMPGGRSQPTRGGFGNQFNRGGMNTFDIYSQPYSDFGGGGSFNFNNIMPY